MTVDRYRKGYPITTNKVAAVLVTTALVFGGTSPTYADSAETDKSDPELGRVLQQLVDVKQTTDPVGLLLQSQSEPVTIELVPSQFQIDEQKRKDEEAAKERERQRVAQEQRAKQAAAQRQAQATRTTGTPRTTPTRKVSTGYCSCVNFAKARSGINVGPIGYAKNHPINTQTPRVGAIMIMHSAWTGHVGVVTAVDGNSVHIEEANYIPCQRSTRTLQKNDPSIRGYYI